MDVLPEGYYLRNFLTLIDWVDEHYSDILQARELGFSQSFRSLSHQARCLYVRLVSRKGPHFRSDKLSYVEVPDLLVSVAECVQAGLLAVNDEAVARELPQLLRVNELRDLLREKGAQGVATLTKAGCSELVLQLFSAEELMDQLRGWFHWYTPLQYESLLVYRLLFFGNLYQDLTEFVLEDLGLVAYESYHIRPEDRLFNSARLVDDTLATLKLGELLAVALEHQATDAVLEILAALPEPDGEPSLLRRQDRMFYKAGYFFERRKDFTQALTCYLRCRQPPARERRARILEKQGLPDESLELCQRMAAEPRDEQERVFSAQFTQKLSRRLGLSVPGITRPKHPSFNLILERDRRQTIEAQVLAHLESKGSQGFYSENHLWTGLFALAFWDVIFMPVRGAFFNRYQRGPKGLFSSSFQEERASAIQQRLSELRAGEGPGLILNHYQQKHGLANDLAHWPVLPRECLEKVLAVVPAKDLALICERLASHPGEFKTGLPDLFVFGSHPRGYELVEVKGPGDTLQVNQRRWLGFFEQHQIPYRVARVAWSKESDP